ISAVQQYCMDSITAGLTRYHGWLGNGSHTRIGSWTSSFLSESVFRKFEADANAVGLYTSDGTNTAHVEIDWFDDSIELLSTRGSNVSYILTEGASNTINSTNGGGSYSRVLTNGSTDTV